MYFSCRGAIYTAKMDGSNVSVFLDQNTIRPDGLVIDFIRDV